tara:strand:- start:134 stop:331 length:198 start_codon:yes stop_codon:yes gene_type:complete
MESGHICTRALSAVGLPKHNFDHNQQKEEFTVEQYALVFEALEERYSRIGALLEDVENDRSMVCG